MKKKKKKQPKYSVVMLKNGEIMQTIHAGNNKDEVFTFFRDKAATIDKDVKFPKKYVKDGRDRRGIGSFITEVIYELAVIRLFRKGDQQRVLTDIFNNTYTEGLIEGKWLVLDRYDYKVEESFKMFGHSKLVPFDYIVSRLVMGLEDGKTTKQVVRMNNKVLIYNEAQFELITCKNIDDGTRLFVELAKEYKRLKHKNVMFVGHVSFTKRTEVYDFLARKTGWSESKLKKMTTRS